MTKRIIDGMNTLGENYIFRDVTNTIKFNIDDSTEKLRLDEKGFYYNGQFIEDAGIAYSRFMEWLDSAGVKTRSYAIGSCKNS